MYSRVVPPVETIGRGGAGRGGTVLVDFTSNSKGKGLAAGDRCGRGRIDFECGLGVPSPAAALHGGVGRNESCARSEQSARHQQTPCIAYACDSVSNLPCFVSTDTLMEPTEHGFEFTLSCGSLSRHNFGITRQQS